jgi:hypothetical protein
MVAWSHLPNCHHIDWVIESVKQNPKLWRAAWNAGSSSSASMAWYALCEEANEVSGAMAKDATEAATDARWFAAYASRWAAVREAAWTAVLTLLVYDDCDQYINMGYEKLWVYAELSENPQAILLLPMVYVREKLGVETVENNSILL